MKSYLAPTPSRTSVANEEVLRSGQDVQIPKAGKIPFAEVVGQSCCVCTATVAGQGGKG